MELTTLEILGKIWPIATVFVGFVVWMVRLEGKVKSNYEKIKMLSDHHEKMSLIETSIAELRNDMNWIKERLNELFTAFLKK